MNTIFPPNRGSCWRTLLMQSRLQPTCQSVLLWQRAGSVTAPIHHGILLGVSKAGPSDTETQWSSFTCHYRKLSSITICTILVLDVLFIMLILFFIFFYSKVFADLILKGLLDYQQHTITSFMTSKLIFVIIFCWDYFFMIIYCIIIAIITIIIS